MIAKVTNACMCHPASMRYIAPEGGKYIQYKTNDVNVLLCSFSMLVKGVPGDMILWHYRIWSIFAQVMPCGPVAYFT